MSAVLPRFAARKPSCRGAVVGALIAAVAFAAATAVTLDPGSSGRSEAAPVTETSTSTFEILNLLRWGHGALDWLLPDHKGGTDAHR